MVVGLRAPPATGHRQHKGVSLTAPPVCSHERHNQPTVSSGMSGSREHDWCTVIAHASHVMSWS